MKLFAHQHWITLQVFNKQLRLCARCTGIVLGFVLLRSGTVLFAASFALPAITGVILAFSFALPSIIDWLTSKLHLRHSNNTARMLTGIFEGVGIGLLSLTNLSLPLRILILTLIGISIIAIGNAKNIFQRTHFSKSHE
jgi:uncharacterized membrane protein